MNENRGSSVLGGILKRGYAAVFYENWPIWFGGVLLGLTSVITFAWARPFGVVGGLRNWGDWFFHLVGVYGNSPESPLISTGSILTLGLLWGAFASALLAKQFALRWAPPFELLKGAVGGTLMGIGSAMAGGCNVGGFYMAISAMSASGFAMMAGLVAGAYVGLRYLYWELEHIPTGAAGGAPGEKTKGFSWLQVEPFVGAAALLAAAVFAWVYTRQAYTRTGGLLLCGMAFGLIIQRSRFCFVRGFRDPFMNGEGEVAKAIALSIIISLLGFAALKWSGLRNETVYVPQAFWLGGLVGGAIFGFGMVVAGGCGSGTVWRVGEGQIKLMVALVCFSLSTSLMEAWINASERLTALMGHSVFLPDVMRYKWTLILTVVVMLAYYLAAAWNEETEKFVVEM